jgi:hypothetical protein
MHEPSLCKEVFASGLPLSAVELEQLRDRWPNYLPFIVVDWIEVTFQPYLGRGLFAVKRSDLGKPLLTALADQAMDAWERSKQPAQRVRRTTGKLRDKRSKDSGNHTDLTERQVQMRVGDVRYLTQARAALAEIRKLYGIGAPYENFAERWKSG